VRVGEIDAVAASRTAAGQGDRKRAATAAITPVSRCCAGAGRAGAPAGTVRAAPLSAVDG
jgi:hypothetical protein